MERRETVGLFVIRSISDEVFELRAPLKLYFVSSPTGYFLHVGLVFEHTIFGDSRDPTNNDIVLDRTKLTTDRQFNMVHLLIIN